MKIQQYEDYKYVMQDVSTVYIGAKYTFAEVVGNEEVPFKFRLIIERYLYPDVDEETTLESHFYYLGEDGLIPKIYNQIKVRARINILREKKSLTGKTKVEYTTKVIPINELIKMSPPEKEKSGVVIQEIMYSKMAMMAF